MTTATRLDVCDLVDRAVDGRVVIVGSLPPAGRDLDLLVRTRERTRIAAALAHERFACAGGQWVRFRPGLPDVVELIPADRWLARSHELDSLFAEALPLDGYANLARPAPHHSLLLVARLTAAAGRLSERRRARVEAALGEDAAAWRRARALAPAWNDAAALDLLERVYRTGRPAGRVARLRAAGAAALPRPRRPLVVALSGIDGAGKSSQAAALRAALDRLGHHAVVEWQPLGQDAWLDRIARPVKRLIARAGARQPAAAGGTQPSEENVGAGLRDRSRLVNEAWATLVAVANGATHARKVARHARRGSVVIFDRYTLDSVVRLRFLYGESRRFRLQRTIIRLLSPTPLVSVLLVVQPETSLARKDDRWSREQLLAHARLYEQEADRYGVVRLDGTRSADDLAAEIAELTWGRLTR